jgi:carboxymethylenebutenolidase
MSYRGIIAEAVAFTGHNGDRGETYYARPSGTGPYPGVVLIHHMPGWDEFFREKTRRFAQHGYVAICPNIYGHFGYGNPDDAAARARGEGGMSDDQVFEDCQASAAYVRSLDYTTDKVGIIGTCSGGRHTYMVVGRGGNFDAAVVCWGGGLVQTEFTPQRPVSPIEMTANIKAPILCLFGNDDQNPPPPMVDEVEARLKKEGKDYEFHRYDGAGHGFYYYQTPNYRPAQAMDAWGKIFTFFEEKLGG